MMHYLNFPVILIMLCW